MNMNFYKLPNGSDVDPILVLVGGATDQFIEGWKALSEEAHKIAESHGFNDKPVNVGEAIALIHSELSEGLEADRKDLNDDKLTHRPGLEVELADAVIRIMHLAKRLDLDVAGAVVEKQTFNQSRPHKHGGKKY